MHGIEDSADGWVANDNQSPAFILASGGYDVWLGNFRGNKYSKKHLYLSEFQKEFWNYSWEEFGLYDIPAFTDYVLANSTKSKLAFIGYSQATTAAMFALT